MGAEEGEDGIAAVGAFLPFSLWVEQQGTARKNRPTTYAGPHPVRIAHRSTQSPASVATCVTSLLAFGASDLLGSQLNS